MATSGFIASDELQQLLDVLQHEGYQCIGPVVKDHAISYQPIQHIEQLPSGIEVSQAPASYQLQQKNHQRRFSWANAANGLKALTFAPHEALWQCHRDDEGQLNFSTQTPELQPTAVIGVRACDIAALRLQEKHFLEQESVDPWFKQRIESLLLIAVHCSHPSSTCFCVSTGDGPEAVAGFDLALHELETGYIITAGSAAGEQIIKQLSLREITAAHSSEAAQQIQQARQQQRRLPNGDIQQALLDNADHPQWQAIGERCLSCGNCTAVCPTCFCNQHHEALNLADNSSQHYREWSSCFTHEHGYISGLNVRPDATLRYRQWLTHKFSHWHEQYGRSGCVGCGRCISWCPVEIDVTQELKILGQSA